MNLTIKRIPDEVGAALRQEAADHGRSLNAELLDVLGKAADWAQRRRKMRTAQGALQRFRASLPRTDSVPILRSERNRH